MDELGADTLVTEEDLDREEPLSIRLLLPSLRSLTADSSLTEEVSSVSVPLALTKEPERTERYEERSD